MLRKFAPVFIGILVIAAIVMGFAWSNTRAESANSNLKTYIQSLVDEGKAFNISTLMWGFDIDGSSIQISELGDDFLCVSGALNVMGKNYKTLCTSFGPLSIGVP